MAEHDEEPQATGPEQIEARADFYGCLRRLFERTGWSYQRAGKQCGLSASTIHGWVSRELPVGLPQREPLIRFLRACGQDIQPWLDAYARIRRPDEGKQEGAARHAGQGIPAAAGRDERELELRATAEDLVRRALEFGWAEGNRGLSGPPYAWVDWDTAPPSLRWADDKTESMLFNTIHGLGLKGEGADAEVLGLLRRTHRGRQTGS